MKRTLFCIALAALMALSACSGTKKGIKDLAWLLLGLGGHTNRVTPINAVGPTASALRTLDFTPADDNAIFVSKAGNDDTGTGTMELPFLTINKAITACDAERQAVVILDSGTYEEKGFEFSGNFKKLVAAIGQAPAVMPIMNGNFMVAGNVIISESAFNGSGTELIKVGKFSNDTYVIAYSESSGRFLIVDKSGTTLVAEKIFESTTVNFKAVSVLSNGNFFISWSNQFVIYDSDGEVVKAKASFTATGDRNESVTLSNDNVVLVVQDSTGILKFTIFDMDGTEVVAEKTVSEKSTSGMNLLSIARFSNDNFVISYFNSTKGYFKIFDSEGDVVVSETEFDTATSATGITTRMEVFNNDHFIIVYTTADYKGYFSIWNSAGENIVPKNNFFSTAYSGSQFDVGIVSSDIFAITMARASDNKGVYFIYDIEGNTVLEDIVFNDAAILGINTEINSDGNALIVYRKAPSATGNLIVRNLFQGPAIRVSADSLVNGITFDGDSCSVFTSLFDCTAPMSIEWCDFAGANSLAAGFVGQSLRTTAGLAIRNSRFYNNGAGVHAQTGAVTITDSQFYQNTDGYALHINGAAASPGDITIDHCDFFNNGGDGVRLEGNNGNEVIRNSIFHDNAGDAVNADVNVTMAYSIVTGTVNNVLIGVHFIGSDPLYVNEGSPGPDDIDLNVQSLFEGYPADSPAIGLGDDGRNAGAHDVEY